MFFMKLIRTIKLAFTVLTLLFCSDLTYGQPRLILSRIGNKNQIVFNEGDVIKLKVKGGDNFFSGPIIGLRDSVIHFKYYDIHLNTIETIDIRNQRFGGFNTGQYGASIMVAAPIYLAIDGLNQGEITDRTIVQAASIFGVGYLLYATRRKFFKLKGRNRVYIIK